MLRRRVAHQLQQIEGPGEIGVEIGARILEAVAHARLRREVIDGVKPRAIGRLQPREILKQQFVAPEVLILLQNRMTAPLQLRVVIGREAVDADDFMSVGEKPRRHMETDESGAAGDEDAHAAQGFGGETDLTAG